MSFKVRDILKKHWQSFWLVSLAERTPLSVSRWVVDRLYLTGENLKTLSLAGMTAGFAALFGALLGGAFSALKIIHHHNVLESYEAILPAIVACCASYLVFVMITPLGIAPTWVFPQYHVDCVDDFALAILYGIIGSLAAWVFISIFKVCAWTFKKISLPIYLRTTMMAALNAVVTRTPTITTLLLTKLIGFFLSPQTPLIKAQPKTIQDPLQE